MSEIEWREEGDFAHIRDSETTASIMVRIEAWDAFVAELRSDLLARVAELEADRDSARRKLIGDAGMIDLAAENARLRQQVAAYEEREHSREARLSAVEDERDDCRARLKATNDAVRRRCIVECEVEAERDAMRPVVEAADRWAVLGVGVTMRGQLNKALIDAVDAWRAAQTDQSASAGDESTYAHAPDCNTVHAGPEDCPPPKSAPADPAGLDAAIEAAVYAVTDSDVVTESGLADVAVRAAAPHLVRGERRAALLEAADGVAHLIAGPSPTSQWGEGYRSGVLASERVLRDRAERETT